MDYWLDLADSELRSKLEQKGVHPGLIDRLIWARDKTEYEEEIVELLEEVFG